MITIEQLRSSVPMYRSMLANSHLPPAARNAAILPLEDFHPVLTRVQANELLANKHWIMIFTNEDYGNSGIGMTDALGNPPKGFITTYSTYASGAVAAEFKSCAHYQTNGSIPRSRIPIPNMVIRTIEDILAAYYPQDLDLLVSEEELCAYLNRDISPTTYKDI